MRKLSALILFAGWGLLMACNFPGQATPRAANGLQTAAAMTVQAALTQSAATTPRPSEVPEQPSATPVAATDTPPPSATPLPSPTATAQPCNLAHFVADVTVPDDTIFKPGEAFTKTWRLQNVGTCTWQNYSLVFDSGDPMGGPAIQPIPGTVAPGQEVDVSVGLTAPSDEGEYKGYWRLRDDKGVVFGLTTGNPFWVAIKVVKPTPTPFVILPLPTVPVPNITVVQDFYSDAPHATWTNNANVHLPFPGSSNDPRGFVRRVTGVILEDGQAYSRALETNPKWSPGGSIRGRYPAVTLPAMAHFRAKIGFLGACSAGDVWFRLYGQFNGGNYVLLGSWHKTCDGTLSAVDVNLSAYGGQQAVFTLAVYAAGTTPPSQDRAVWVSPEVSTP